MVAVAHVAVEVLPESQILPECAITAAGHIAKDPIEFQRRLVLVEMKIWEEARIVVCDEQRGRVEPPRLVGQHVSSLYICVVRDDESSTILRFLVLLFSVQILQHLDGFGPWGSTHVQAFVCRFDIQQRHRNHAHLLLPEYPSIFCLFNQKLVEFLKRRRLPHLDSSDIIEREGKLVRIPRHRLRPLILQAWIGGDLVDVVSKVLLRLFQIAID